MRKIKVAIDLDGVIWDLVTPWVDTYNDIYKDDVKKDELITYNISLYCNKATELELKNILGKKNFWRKVTPFKESIQYLGLLNNEYDLYVATATSHITAFDKIDRFLYLFPYIKKEQIICIHNKQLLNVDWMVDDCAENLYGGNFNKILIDASYNRQCNDFVRAENLKDVYNLLKNYYREDNSGRNIYN